MLMHFKRGGWEKPKPIIPGERTCFNCNIIEDEFQFVLVCPLYTHFRHYIPKYYKNKPSMFKFLELLNSNNTKIVRRLAIYCFKAFEHRNTILFK